MMTKVEEEVDETPKVEEEEVDEMSKVEGEEVEAEEDVQRRKLTERMHQKMLHQYLNMTRNNLPYL